MSELFTDKVAELRLLSTILKNEEALNIVASRVTLTCFTDLTAMRLYDLIIRFYKRYGKALSQKILEAKLQKENYTYNEKVDIQLFYINAVNSPGDENILYYIDRLRDLRTKRDLYGLYYNLKQQLEDEKSFGDLILSDLLNTAGLLSHHTEDAEVARLQIDDNPQELWREYEDREAHPEKYAGLKLGFKGLDDALLGGILPGWLGLIFARTGVGKSMMLFNIACNVVLQNKSVLYITIEMPAAILQTMWASHSLKIPFKNIINATLNDDEKKKYRKFLLDPNKVHVPFTIVDIPRGCSPSTVESEIVAYTRRYGCKPDLVLIDYVNLMSPDEKWEKETDKYGNIMKELHKVTRVRKVTAITAMQQNRESLKAKTIGLEHISLSDQAVHHCEFAVNVRRKTEGDNSYGRGQPRGWIIAELLKVRYGPLVSCELFADFACNLIQDMDHAYKIEPLDGSAIPPPVPTSEPPTATTSPETPGEHKEF